MPAMPKTVLFTVDMNHLLISVQRFQYAAIHFQLVNRIAKLWGGGGGGGGEVRSESRCWANVQYGAQGRETHHGPTAAERLPPCAGDWASPVTMSSILTSCAMTTSNSTDAHMHVSLQSPHVQDGAHSSRMS